MSAQHSAALPRELMVLRVCRELRDGMVVNLGLGIPTLLADIRLTPSLTLSTATFPLTSRLHPLQRYKLIMARVFSLSHPLQPPTM